MRHVLPLIALTGLSLTASPAATAEIQVFTSGAPSAVQNKIARRFQAASGHRVVITAETLSNIRTRIGAEKPDVIVLPRPAMTGLETAGELRPRSLVHLARVGIGVTVREGTPLPDISTVDALRRTLLNAKSIAHPDPQGGGFAGAQVDRMFEKLGIADAVRPKVTLMYAFGGGVENIAKGGAEIGLFNISEIVPTKGVTLVGPLPRDLQSYITFSGALHARSSLPEAGAAFLAALVDPAARDDWKSGGFEALDGR
jgi:molybdate transport system substrate-binding protein